MSGAGDGVATTRGKQTQMRARARREAPTIASLLEGLDAQQIKVADTRAAWDELLRLADDRRMGAKEASAVLGVQGPNLYATLRGPDALRLFGAPIEPVDTLAMGAAYRARDIEALAQARRRPDGQSRSKRKQRPQGTVAGE